MLISGLGRILCKVNEKESVTRYVMAEHVIVQKKLGYESCDAILND